MPHKMPNKPQTQATARTLSTLATLFTLIFLTPLQAEEAALTIDQGRVGVGLSGVLPSANLHVKGTVKMEGSVEVVGGSIVLNGVVDAKGNKIVNVATPTVGTDAVNKAYVDGQIDLFHSPPTILVTSGQYTVPNNVTKIKVLCLGGGGSGGGGLGNSGGSPGGGGGGSGYVKEGIINVTGGQKISYQIGAGGLGVIGWTAGNDGGDTTFGSIIAKGGMKGNANVGGQGLIKGGNENTNGGSDDSNLLRLPFVGQSGGFGINNGVDRAGGGGAPCGLYYAIDGFTLGNGGDGGGTNINGFNATGYGAGGGGGGALGSDSGGSKGGNGSNGAVVVWILNVNHP